MAGCTADLAAQPPDGFCPACLHLVIAHNRDQRCAACQILADWELAPRRGPSHAGPQISTRNTPDQG